MPEAIVLPSRDLCNLHHSGGDVQMGSMTESVPPIILRAYAANRLSRGRSVISVDRTWGRLTSWLRN